MITRIFFLAILCLSIGCKSKAPSKTTSAKDLVELVKSGDFESVRLAIDADKTLANATRSDGVPLLYFAAANNRQEIVAYLLDMGATIETGDDSGSALHVAVDSEFDAVVRLLLERGVDPNLQDGSKQSPLHLTTENRRDIIARLLIDSGADINARDREGRTPLHRCKSLAVAKLLVGKGADVNAVDDSGYTPLHWAATPRENVNPPTIQFLLSEGADVNRTDKAGLTPRQMAIKNDQKHLVAILDSYKP